MYHAGWAWAGDTPFRYTKLIASHFGGTRNPMAISWPARIKPDKTPRSQFHHVNDIVPTIYEILGIKPPQGRGRLRAGPDRRHEHGLHVRRRQGARAQAHPVFRQQRQPRHLSRRLVCLHLRPADAVAHGEPGTRHLGFEQGRLGALRPRRPTFRRPTTSREGAQAARRDEGAVPEGSEGEQGLPDRRRHLAAHSSGRSRQDAVHELAVRLDDDPHAGVHAHRAWAARATTSTIDAELGENASGVLYALGGASGGLTLYMDKGQLVYEYNMMIIERYTARSKDKLAPGKHRIEVDTQIAKPGRTG